LFVKKRQTSEALRPGCYHQHFDRKWCIATTPLVHCDQADHGTLPLVFNQEPVSCETCIILYEAYLPSLDIISG